MCIQTVNLLNEWRSESYVAAERNQAVKVQSNFPFPVRVVLPDPRRYETPILFFFSKQSFWDRFRFHRSERPDYDEAEIHTWNGDHDSENPYVKIA